MATSGKPEPSSGTSEPWEASYPVPAWYVASQRNAGVGSVAWHSTGNAPLPCEPQGCRICDGQPVAAVSVKRHVGLIFWGTTHTAAGPFCRQCGIARVRDLTTRSLWQGWWGLLSVPVNLVVLAENLDAYQRLKRLPSAVPVPGQSPLAPGRPVLLRPAAYISLVPAAWSLWLIASLVLRL